MRSSRRPVLLSLIALMSFCGVFASLGAETIGPVRITLRYARHYEWWGSEGLTVLAYRVKSQHPVDGWILGLDPCILREDVFWWAETEWVDDPIRGLRFTPTSSNESFYVYLNGLWDLDRAAAAILNDGQIYLGEVDGPACSGTSIGLEIASGAQVGFPTIIGSGRFPSLDGTVLRVTSSEPGWTLDYSVTVSGPDGADEETIRRVFCIEVEPFAADPGTTEIEINYALELDEADFTSLPQGSYAMTITYTLSAE